MFTNQVRRVTNSDRINVSLESRRAAKNGMVPRELAMPAPEAVHLVPKDTSSDPVDVSIVVPALNEALVIGEFVEWCKEGLALAGVKGQILIVDSSTDRTAEIAFEHGSEVLRTPKRRSFWWGVPREVGGPQDHVLWTTELVESFSRQ